METPQNPDAERAILSAAMQWPETIPEIDRAGGRALFFLPHSRAIWAGIRKTATRDGIDVIVLGEHLRGTGELEACGGIAGLADIMADMPTKALLPEYLTTCQVAAKQRRIIEVCERAVRKAYLRETPIEIARELDSATRELMAEESNDTTRHLSSVLFDVIDEIQQFASGTAQSSKIPTGFAKLDAMIGGFAPADMVVVGARPGRGKTAFAGNLAANFAAQGVPVAFFSAEMRAEDIASRMLCREAGVDGKKLLDGSVSSIDLRNMGSAVSAMANWPVYMDDRSGMRLLDIEIGCRRMTRDYGVKIAFVDYLQLIREESGSRNREDAVRRLSNGLKQLGKELGITVVALAQLNRAGDDEPRVTHLRDSGSIEQDADKIILLHMVETKDSTWDGKWILAKHRGGQIGEVEVAFNRAMAEFSEK